MTDQLLCTFCIQNLIFGIDIEMVQEIMQQATITRVPLAAEDICGLINLRGQIATVVHLQHRLGLRSPLTRSIDPAQPTPAAATEWVDRANPQQETEYERGYHIVVRTNGEIISLWVAQIGDILQLNSADFERPPATLQGQMRQFLQGAYKLSEGFLLVLDPQKVLQHTNPVMFEIEPPHPPTPSPNRRRGAGFKVPLPLWKRDLG